MCSTVMTNVEWQYELIANEQTLSAKLQACFALLQDISSDISRLGVVIYDPETELLRTLHKFEQGCQAPELDSYQLKLCYSQTLTQLSKGHSPRVVNDLQKIYDDNSHHGRVLKSAGYRSSYTLPIQIEGQFWGFVFVNGSKTDVFQDAVLKSVMHLSFFISQLVYSEIKHNLTFRSAIQTVLRMGHIKDPETQGHLKRMSLYSELIANELAQKYHRPAYFALQVKMYAPLHDIGKYRVPEVILFSDKRFTDVERYEMNKHPQYGLELIEDMQREFGFSDSDDMNILKNIIIYHHERVDGMGYPTKLHGDEIPLEARIVAVSDVFDALMSERPYKKPWSLSDVLSFLNENKGKMFDHECIQALINNIDQVKYIHQTYHDSGDFSQRACA